MVIVEYFRTRSDGVVLNRTYSNLGMCIEREGVLYGDAIDPAEFNRTYTETSTPVDDYELFELASKARAYDILTGVAE